MSPIRSESHHTPRPPIVVSLAKPVALDLTWRPPGFDGMCRDEKGQKVLGILRGDDKLEVVLDFSGKKRPAAFQPNKSCYRLVFRRLKQ